MTFIAEVVENDPLSTFIGRNDGFRVGNARVGITAAYGEDLSAYISLEASVPRTEDFNQPNAELTDDQLLLADGIIDSLGIFTLIAFIEQQFGLKIGPEDVILENFESVNKIKALIVARQASNQQTA